MQSGKRAPSGAPSAPRASPAASPAPSAIRPEAITGTSGIAFATAQTSTIVVA